MAPKFKRAEVASLTFIAFVPGATIPDKLSLGDHSLEFPGSDKLSNSLISGVYGAQAKAAAVIIAAEWNKELEKGRRPSRALLVDTQYRIDNMQEGSRALITRETLDLTGWLHLDRLQADFRDELKVQALEWLRNDVSRAAAVRAEELDLRRIFLEHPELVKHLFAARRQKLVGVVHPVRPKVAPDEELLAATVRYDANRFVEASVRYLDTEVLI